ncbi:MAG TPA: SUMF1/EgtB/PvdO family nonheme iron enzyme [Thermoguttaceae bacterium]|nr:SUMF1/EgtB/PvdO family nonheme iron enzyme [Thermoguttaceae bacterium]
MPLNTESSSRLHLAVLGLVGPSLLLAGVLLPCAVRAAEPPPQHDPAPPEHDMVYVPAGEFVMGTTEDDAQRLAEQYDVHPTLFLTETPQRKVHVEVFWIDRYPVTNAQYKRFIDATGEGAPYGWRGRDYPEGTADHPVTSVGWHAANVYACWAGLRLPTEAEWEKAARGTDGRTYPWGDSWRDDATRIDDPRRPQTRALTTPVGAFPAGASPFGVMDLAGNVAEWTSTPSQPPNAERNWAWYVVKGAGAALSRQYNFRCASRNFSAHTSRWHTWLGFRCAKDAADTPQTVAAKPSLDDAPKLPPIAPVEGPLAELFGKEPIQIEPRPGHAGVVFRVPYFPVGQFSSFVPEQAGAAGVPLAWAAKHEGVQWQQSAEGACEYLCKFPGKAEMRVTLVPMSDCVDFTIAIRNLTDEPFTGVQTNTCFNVHASPYFENPERTRSFVWTDAGPTCMLRMPIGHGSGEPLHGGWGVARADQESPAGGSLVRHPIIAIASRDGQWIIAQAYGEGTSVASNAHYSCLHARPRWPDVPPGEERSMTGKYYFLRGGPEELLDRWKADFVNETTSIRKPEVRE